MVTELRPSFLAPRVTADQLETSTEMHTLPHFSSLGERGRRCQAQHRDVLAETAWPGKEKKNEKKKEKTHENFKTPRSDFISRPSESYGLGTTANVT